MANLLYRQDLISIADLSTPQLELLLNTALKLKAEPRDDLLEGKLIGSCFSSRPPVLVYHLKPLCSVWAAR